MYTTTTLKILGIELSALSVYKNLLQDPAVAALLRLCRNVEAGSEYDICSHYTDIFCGLKAAGETSLGEHLFSLMRYEENVFSRSIAAGNTDPQLLEAAQRDHEILSHAAALSCRTLKAQFCSQTEKAQADVFRALPEWDTVFLPPLEEICAYYKENGFGIFAKYRAFRYIGGKLLPVLSPDPIDPCAMIGYDWQRTAVLENTRALLSGRFVNNVLLYGDSGTGKSATVKSMLNVPEFRILRIIEVARESISDISPLLESLKTLPQKFIVFIDDLSFEDGDKNYSALKVILEGGMERRPDNVTLYVTSNRRQLVKRRFSDREDELDSTETVQEKTSLADRFGIRIPYLAPDHNGYIDMAIQLAQQQGCTLPTETLRQKARQWEMEHGSRTPRTAVQFADYIMTEAQGEA